MNNIAQKLGFTQKADLFHPSRFLYSFIFIVFTLMFMTYAPRFIARYVPIEYYTVKQPVEVNREEYKPGDKITVTLIRSSSINVSAHSTVQVYLYDAKGKLYKHNPLFDGNVIVEKSDGIIAYLTYTLPTDLPNGVYYIKALVDYPNPNDATVRNSYIWTTKVFTVDSNSEEVN